MAKKKPTKATPKKKSASDWAPRFLSCLASTANILAACRLAKVDRSNVYKRRDRDDAFAAAMKDALDDAVDELELEARRRALFGVRRMKFHQGAPIMVPLLGEDGAPLTDAQGEITLTPYLEHEYSDVLAMFLLKAHRPNKYRDNHHLTADVNVTTRRYVGIDPDAV